MNDLCCADCACTVHTRPPRNRPAQTAQGRGTRARAAVVALALGVALAGCAPEADRGRGAVYHARAEVEQAQAEATRIANQKRAALDKVEIEARQTASAAELGARLAELEAQRRSAEAYGEARAVATRAAGYAGSVALGGLALALLILAGGWAMATIRRAWAAAQYVTIAVEQATLQAPLIVTIDGYLLDPKTGERARLRDRAGVDRLRLQAATALTQAALAGRAAEAVAKATGRPEDAAGLLLAPHAGKGRKG